MGEGPIQGTIPIKNQVRPRFEEVHGITLTEEGETWMTPLPRIGTMAHCPQGVTSIVSSLGRPPVTPSSTVFSTAMASPIHYYDAPGKKRKKYYTMYIKAVATTIPGANIGKKDITIWVFLANPQSRHLRLRQKV